MQQAEVVVRRIPGTDGQVRTGVILARQNAVLRVRWDDDGREEDVRISTTTTFAVRGSVRYQGLATPDALLRRLENEPVAVFVQLLQEHGSPLTAIQIQAKLTDLGLDRESVGKAWKRSQRKLREVDGVRTVNKSYRWAKPNPQTNEAGLTASSVKPPAKSTNSAKSTAENAGVPVPREDSGSATSPADSGRQPATDKGDAAERSRRAASRPSRSAAEVTELSTPDERIPLGAALATSLGDDPTPPAAHYLKRPLATAVRLGRLDDAGLGRLLASVRAEDLALLSAFLIAAPRSPKHVDGLNETEVDPALVQSIMVSSAAELRRQSSTDSETISAVGRLLRRAVGLSLDPAVTSTLIELAAAIAMQPRKDDLETLESVAGLLSKLLPAAERGGVDLDAVSRFAARLPFTPEGGRAALLAAVGGLWPETISEPVWWRDATLTDLGECTTGILRSITSRAEVLERVIVPLMRRELSAVTTRVRLARLLALPTQFVEHFPPEAVANAFRNVRDNDPIVESWLRMLTGEDRIARLSDDVERARDETRRAIERAEHAEADGRDLAERYERLEKLLQQQHEESLSMRASQERQLQIDAVRALANLAAEVEELAASDVTYEILVERVRACVSDQDLEPVGEVGGSSAFDRDLHEPLIGAPANGETVTVLRSGYRWRSGGEDLVLFRALVQPPQP